MAKVKGNEGWEDLESGAVAMSTRKADYKVGGQHFVESGFDFNTASASQLKQQLGDMKVGETRTLNAAHSWKLQKKISSEPGQKSCTYRVVEQDGLDENAPVSNNNTSSSYPSADPSSPDGLTPLQVLKNFVDNIAADVRGHRNWLIALGMCAAVALVVAGATAIKLFF